MPSILAVKDLVKHYPGVNAVNGISFELHKGICFGLLGPNGAGKTTVLRILSTVLRPTSGTATVNGFDVLTQPSLVRHQIGFVSNNTAVYDRMTAWEMVEYFGRLHGIPNGRLAERMERRRMGRTAWRLVAPRARAASAWRIAESGFPRNHSVLIWYASACDAAVIRLPDFCSLMR